MTGQLEEEKMQVYVRLGIRLLYKVSSITGRAYCSPLITNHRAGRAGWRAHEVSLKHHC